MALETEVGERGGGQPIVGGVTLRALTFAYEDAAAPALSGVSFSVDPGERVGVIGRVGCGKSTLGRVISGLYSANDGLLLIDNVDIRQFGTARLRDAIAYCPQESALFSGTLRTNILMGRPYADEEMLARAVRLSGVASFAAGHPQGLSMPVVEGGRNLSGGERQAVALARVLIREPKVLFLDEPSAALDARSEHVLMESLKEIGKSGLTLFISTHRDRLLEAVDRLLVFDNGHLVADGPKEEVIAALRERASGGFGAGT